MELEQLVAQMTEQIRVLTESLARVEERLTSHRHEDLEQTVESHGLSLEHHGQRISELAEELNAAEVRMTSALSEALEEMEQGGDQDLTETKVITKPIEDLETETEKPIRTVYKAL